MPLRSLSQKSLRITLTIFLWERMSMCTLFVILENLYRVNLLFYKGCAEQPSPLPLRIVFIIYGASMYVVDDDSRSCRRCKGLDD